MSLVGLTIHYSASQGGGPLLLTEMDGEAGEEGNLAG
jgi:hypothetical protein